MLHIVLTNLSASIKWSNVSQKKNDDGCKLLHVVKNTFLWSKKFVKNGIKNVVSESEFFKMAKKIAVWRALNLGDLHPFNLFYSSSFNKIGNVKESRLCIAFDKSALAK